MREHPALPLIQVVDPVLVAYDALPDAGGETLDAQLRRTLPQARLDELRFRQVSLPPELLRACAQAEDMEFYERIAKTNTEGGRRRLAIVKQHRDAFRSGADVPAIVIALESGWPQMLDGLHRAAAAWDAGVEMIPAFELVDARLAAAPRDAVRRVEDQIRRFRQRIEAKDRSGTERMEPTEEQRERARKRLLGEID